MPKVKENPRIEVSPKKDGVVITVEGIEIDVTVRPVWRTLQHNSTEEGLSVELLKKDLTPFLKDLDIIEKTESIIVKPKRFLGRSFAPVVEIVEY